MKLQARRGDAGLTLLELIAVMALMGILLALGIPGWSKYRAASAQSGTARVLVGELRHLQVRAQTEETTYRATFASGGASVTMQRKNPATGTWTTINTVKPESATVTYNSPSFTLSDGSTASYVEFYARGSATKGTVLIKRTGSTKVYTVTVEGLTARVDYS